VNDADGERDRELWQRLGGLLDREAPSPCADVETMAAYLDARLPAAEVERMERHLASCGDCLTALTELRVACREPAAAAPRGVLERARSLVSPVRPVETSPAAVARFVPRTRRATIRTVLELAAAAAIVLFSCWAGLGLGGAFFEQRQLARAAVVSSCTFGLGAPSAGPMVPLPYHQGDLP
jgi:anti-sigma factor RsiW